MLLDPPVGTRGRLDLGPAEPSGHPHRRPQLAVDLDRDGHDVAQHVLRAGIEALRYNTAIARITELCNHVTASFPDGVPREVAEAQVLMLAPLAPHIAEELWQRMGHASSLAWEAFPDAGPEDVLGDVVTIPIQVNGKLRATVQVARGLGRAEVEAAARADRRIQAHLAGRSVAKVVVVPDQLLNFVVSAPS